MLENTIQVPQITENTADVDKNEDKLDGRVVQAVTVIDGEVALLNVPVLNQ